MEIRIETLTTFAGISERQSHQRKALLLVLAPPRCRIAQANAMSASVGGGIQAGLIVLSGADTGKDEDQASSVTVSAISTGSVNITDSPRSKPSQAKML